MKSNSFKFIFACTLYWISSNLFAQQPTMNQLVGINVKPQENLQGATRFSTIRSWHLFEDDISQGGGGMETAALSMPVTRSSGGIPVITEIN
jgi:hypothetical protein